ncbi:hypothetical protein AMK16_24925 [Streptomyces sp. CB00455]|uniref:hypothetical protein n=1 Tax=Streptomyces sp. CB00455 TaxID=1703927 RepID=UPI0009670716|nr:hypothetical protein [Streptomyces sp. CB00455]OKK15992.1 hypothetical protein AMK16_24925 [Streptomyces sp. CB00455]
MPGEHARPTSTLFRSTPGTGAPPAHGKHSRRGSFAGRLRRRILAYRDIEFLSSRIPGDGGAAEEECLLLVHTRRVVGQVHYRICAVCAEGVITGVDIEERLRSSGLGTRALSHLRSRHPGIAWRSTLTRRTTQELLRRMRIPTAPSAAALCVHVQVAPRAVGPAGAHPLGPRRPGRPGAGR